DERDGPAARRALARLDPPGGALSRAHQGRRPGRLLPGGRLGRGDRAGHPQGRAVSASELPAFLRRELAPTPGRGGHRLRLTVACLIATIPVLTHRIPHALIVMIMAYLITQEDRAATLIGSILGVIGVTVGVGLALLAWEISLDTPSLRIGFFAGFF